MSKLEIFITNPIKLSAGLFYPRNYNPKYLFVKEGMSTCPTMFQYIIGDIKGGSTPPAYFFYKDFTTKPSSNQLPIRMISFTL